MGCRPALLGLSAILGNTPLNELASLIEPTLREMGFELVQVLVMGKERRTLQVMAEPTDQTRQMTIEDCAEISRAVSAILDVADPLPGEYRLEVSSPGIDRPLVRPQDYVRFAGFEARLETVMLQDGQRRFTGILRGLDGDEVLLEAADGVRRIGLDGIRKAKLTLSDALLKAGLKAGAAGREQG